MLIFVHKNQEGEGMWVQNFFNRVEPQCTVLENKHPVGEDKYAVFGGGSKHPVLREQTLNT